MAISQIHTTAEQANASPSKSGRVAAALLNWQPHGDPGPAPFGARTGAEAASAILSNAHALSYLLAVGFEENEGEFSAVTGVYKRMALEGVGELILLAKALIDDE